MSFTTHFSVVNNIGDEHSPAWNRFFQQYQPLIKLHGKDCGIPENALDDLVQNVMLSVFKQSATFSYDSSKGRFRDYLRTIIRARANDMLRAVYKQAKVLDFTPDEACLDDLYKAEWQDYIKKESLRKLKEESSAEHYQLFYMLEIQNRSVRETADFLDLPKATVYSIRQRMEEKLRQTAKELDV